MFCKFQQNWSSSFGDFEISFGTAHFRLPSFPARVTLIYKKFNYQCKLRLLEAIQNWYFECMSFKNCSTDLLEIFIQSVKVYTHCVCEISQWSESNCMFENQKIEITYQNYSYLNSWATLMKQKPNYSQYVEQEEDIFRYVKNSELTREIMCNSDWIFPHLHQCYQW